MPTKIEWTNFLPGYKGEVWNPVTGCSKVSAGCKNCYAETMAARFWKGRKFTDVQCHKDRLDIPFHWKKPRLVFVNSMSDLFHEKVPFEFILDMYITMTATPRHKYLILTKRPERALEFYEWFIEYIKNRLECLKVSKETIHNSIKNYNIKNIWVGVSAEDQETADKRIPILLQIPASVRWVSYEPALGEVNLNPYLSREGNVENSTEFMETIYEQPDYFGDDFLNWVVVGGESGHNARPMHPNWVRKVRDDCKSAGVPFFFKQWGEWVSPHQNGMFFSERRKLNHLLMDSKGNIKKLSNESIKNLDLDFRIIFKAGKKAAGRLLDGVEYREYPKIN